MLKALGVCLAILAISTTLASASVDQQAVITTIAGGGAVDVDGGLATKTLLADARGIAIDASGNIYIAHGGWERRVRKVDVNGVITTVAGNGDQLFNGEDIPAIDAGMEPESIAVDPQGNLYIWDAVGTRIRKVTANGKINTVVGTGAKGYSGDGGPAIRASIITARDMEIDTHGDLFFVDVGRIRKVDLSTGTITSVAGNGTEPEYPQDGQPADGDGSPATNAGLRDPNGIAVGSDGSLYIAESGISRIRKVTPDGIIHTYAGGGIFRSDPVARNAKLWGPTEIDIDSRGNLYFTESIGLVRQISPQGFMRVIAGKFNDVSFNTLAQTGFSGDGGPAVDSLLEDHPKGLILDQDDAIYFADSRNNRVRKITPVGSVPVIDGAFAFAPHALIPDPDHLMSSPYFDPGEGIATATASGDVTGDGRDDVIVKTTWNGTWPDPKNLDKILVFEQKPDGTLAMPMELLLNTSQSIGQDALALGDLNNDGIQDIISGQDSGITIFLGGANLPGRKNFSSPAGFSSNLSLAVFDVDQDGRPDVVAGASGSQGTGIVTYFGDGLGGIRAKSSLPTSGYQEGPSIEAGDLNSDGRTDLAVLETTSDIQLAVHVYLNTGSGWSSQPLLLPGFPAYGRPASVAIGDFNSDGRADLGLGFSFNTPEARLITFYQTEDGGFGAPVVEKAYDSPDGFLTADMNGDRRDDLLVRHSGWRAIGYRKQMSWGLDAEVKYVTKKENHPGARATAVGDINADGCMDMLAASDLYGLLYFYGDECVIRRPQPNNLNGDRLSDILWTNKATGAKVGWISADGLRVHPIRDVSNISWQVVGSGDFDGDGESDLLWRNFSTGVNAIWRSANYLAQRKVATVPNLSWVIVGIADFNGDGKSDILWRNRVSGANVIWRAGNSRDMQSVTAVSSLAWHVTGTGDFNGDGRDDILWRNSNTGAGTIWKSGNSLATQAVTRVTSQNWQVTGLGDFNGDGDSDIFWRNMKTGMNTIWRSADSGDQLNVSGVTDLAWHVVAVGDYTGDGNADLLWRNVETGSNTIWISGNYKDRQVVRRVNPAWDVIR